MNGVRIRSEKIITISENTASVEAEIWVSASEDLPAYDGIDGRLLVPGSIAVVQAESKIYVLGFDNAWKEWGAVPAAAASTLNANAVGSLDRTSLRLDPTELTTETDDLTAERAIEDGVF